MMPQLVCDRRTAMAKAHQYFRDRQSGEGSWPGFAIAGPDATAEIAIALAFAGLLSPTDAGNMVAYLQAQQLPDGSFPPFEKASVGTLDETCICYAALLSANVAPSSEPAAKAYRYITEQGGFLASSAYTRILLVSAGVLPPGLLRPMPIFLLLIPKVERFLGTRFASAFTIMSILLPAMNCALRCRVDKPGWLRGFAVRAAHRKALRYLTGHQNPTGNLYGAANMSAMMLIAFRLLGVPNSDNRVLRLVADMQRWRSDASIGLGFTNFNSSVWNSSLILGALSQGGIDSGDPASVATVQFLLQQQSAIPLPKDWQNPRHSTPRTGGWAFEDGNPLAADCDSTSVVLWGLSFILPRSPQLQRAIDMGLTWLWGMQGDDGGWPSFSRGQSSKPAGPFPLTQANPDLHPLAALQLMLHVPPQFADTSLEDVTGRVLQALGRLGFRASDARVARAIGFLHSQIDVNGVWWGRWETNYLAATAEALAGLGAVGADLTHPAVRNAIAWVKAHQHVTGGFGETTESYSNMALAGAGEPSSYLTGLVANALIACGEARSESVSRAIQWCLDRQLSDGSWEQGSYQFTMQWPWPFYQLTLTPVIYPLRAITEYNRVLAG